MTITAPPLRTREPPEARPEARLRLTIAFHPNPDRVGASIDLCDWPEASTPAGPRPITVGRLAPRFSDGEPLNEVHVSREAVVFSFAGTGLQAVPGCAASLCRIGRAQRPRLLLDREALVRGVPVRLGHGVVLLLRLVTPRTRPDLPELDPQWFPGASEEVRELRQLIRLIAVGDRPVWLVGETGVGKELVARAIHQTGPRHRRPLVAVNMAAIPESLAASELFGTQRGAFTGATPRRGYFREADGGTLFLDEIGDAPSSVQAQLLRVLQTGEIQVVGGRPERVDTRIVAATESHLAGTGFRSALRERLQGFSLEILPLRRRPEDIGVMATLTLRRCDTSDTALPFARCQTSPRAAAHWARFYLELLSRDWPGNARELDNVVQQAALGDPRVLPAVEREPVLETCANPDDQRIVEAYRRHGCEVAATARALGMSRQSLYRRIDSIAECRVASDVSDQELRAAIERHGRDPWILARALGVSARALRQRLGN